MELDQVSPSFYRVLGVNSDSSIHEIRRSYRKLAMQWHPDRWTRTTPSSSLGEAKCKFQQIQEAYSVLSDQRKRAMYDIGLYDPDDEEDEGFSDFMQEMLSLMSSVKREEKEYSMEELQGMLNEMIQDFKSPSVSSHSPSWYCGPSVFDESGRTKRARSWDENSTMSTSCTHVPVSGLRMCEASSFCS